MSLSWQGYCQVIILGTSIFSLGHFTSQGAGITVSGHLGCWDPLLVGHQGMVSLGLVDGVSATGLLDSQGECSGLVLLQHGLVSPGVGALIWNMGTVVG